MRTIRRVLIGCAVACASLASAGSPQLTELGRLVPGFEEPGWAGFPIADFDADGQDEIVVTGRGVFQVIGREGNGFAIEQSVFVPGFNQLLALPAPGAPGLLAVRGDGLVVRYTGWPLVETQAFNIGELQEFAAAVGDIDNDGELELVTASWIQGLRAHALSNGNQRWQLPAIEAADVLLAQMDGDPALEIVLASAYEEGLVLDGATQATDWSYKDGFGYYLASGEFQPGGGMEFVAADGGIFRVFQSAPWSPLWDELGYHPYAIGAGDVDGDGIDEILIGEGGAGGVVVFDTQVREARLEVPVTVSSIASVVHWKPDGGGDSYLAFSPQMSYWRTEPLFRVAGAMDGGTAWEILNDKPGTYAAVALGHLGRPAPSLVFAATDSQDFEYGAWTQLDGFGGGEQWESPRTGSSDDPFGMEPGALLVRDAGVPAPQLLLAGRTSSDGARFVSLDGATHAVRWVQDGTTHPTLADRRVADMQELDIGAIRSIVSCLNSGTGVRLFIMDAETGAPQWESVAMDGGFEGCRNVIAGQFTDGADPLVVAVLPTSLRAFNASTHVLEWVLGVQAHGASLIEHGENGREFVVFNNNVLRFHDATSRALLRQFALDDDVTAVTQIGDDIHRLAVAAGGRILLVDGVSGSTLQSSDYLGTGLAVGSRLAVHDAGGGTFLIAAGSSDGVIRFRLTMGEQVFRNGFELNGK